MRTLDSLKRYEDKGKQKKRYPTDLSNEEWAYIEPLLPSAAPTGRPRQVDFREVINAIRYLVRSGCGWPMLPYDFPPYETVHYWFRRFIRRMLFQTISYRRYRTICPRRGVASLYRGPPRRVDASCSAGKSPRPHLTRSG
jgi:transposase